MNMQLFRPALLNAARQLLAPGAVYDASTRDAVDGLFSGLSAIENAPVMDTAHADRRVARAAFAKVLRGSRVQLSSDEKRLLAGGANVFNIAEGAPSTGGVLVPNLLFPELLTRIKFYSAIASVARFFCDRIRCADPAGLDG